MNELDIINLTEVNHSKSRVSNTLDLNALALLGNGSKNTISLSIFYAKSYVRYEI